MPAVKKGGLLCFLAAFSIITLKNYTSDERKVKMKKIVLIMILFTLFALSACSTGSEQNDASRMDLQGDSGSKEENSAGKDFTVKGDFKEYQDIESKNIISVTSHLDFSAAFPDMDSLVSHSDEIIEFKVDNIRYTFLRGSGYTVCDVTVTKSFAGKLKAGDRISLLQYGGIFTIEEETNYWHDEDRFRHLTEAEQQNSLIISKATAGVDYHKGDIFVAFIAKDDFLKGSYSTLNYGEGVFVYQDKETLTRYYGDDYVNNEIKYSDLPALQSSVSS